MSTLAYCLLPISWLLYEYHHVTSAEVAAAIAYAFMISELHLLRILTKAEEKGRDLERE
jgi:hypothetical protein